MAAVRLPGLARHWQRLAPRPPPPPGQRVPCGVTSRLASLPAVAGLVHTAASCRLQAPAVLVHCAAGRGRRGVAARAEAGGGGSSSSGGGSGSGGGNSGSGGSGGGSGGGGGGGEDPPRRRVLLFAAAKLLAAAAVASSALLAAVPMALSHPWGLKAAVAAVNLTSPVVAVHLDRVEAAWKLPLQLHGLRLVQRGSSSVEGSSGGGGGSSSRGEAAAPFDPSSSSSSSEDDEEAALPTAAAAGGGGGTNRSSSSRRRRSSSRGGSSSGGSSSGAAADADPAVGARFRGGSGRKRRTLVSVERVSTTQTLWEMLSSGAADVIITRPQIDCTINSKGNLRLMAVLQEAGLLPVPGPAPHQQQEADAAEAAAAAAAARPATGPLSLLLGVPRKPGGGRSSNVAGSGAQKQQQQQQQSPAEALGGPAVRQEAAAAVAAAARDADSSESEEESPSLAQAAAAAAESRRRSRHHHRNNGSSSSSQGGAAARAAQQQRQQQREEEQQQEQRRSVASMVAAAAPSAMVAAAAAAGAAATGAAAAAAAAARHADSSSESDEELPSLAQAAAAAAAAANRKSSSNGSGNGGGGGSSSGGPPGLRSSSSGGGSGSSSVGSSSTWLPESLQFATSAVAFSGELRMGKLSVYAAEGALLVPTEVRELLGKNLHFEVLKGASAIEEAAANERAIAAAAAATAGSGRNGSSSSSSSSSGSGIGGGGGSSSKKPAKWVRQRPAVLLPWGTGMLQTPVSLRLDSELMQFKLQGWQTARGFTYLHRPIEASMHFTPALSRYLLTMLHPVLGGSVGLRGSTIVEGRLMPHDGLWPTNQATVRIEPLAVEIGESPLLRQSVGVLSPVVSKGLKLGGAFRAELSPLQATLGADGRLTAERLDIKIRRASLNTGLLKEGLHLVSWGSASLQPPQALDATLCIPGDALAALGLPGLPEGSGLPLHISGTPSKPVLEVAGVTKQLALLLAKQQAAKLAGSNGGIPQWLKDQIDQGLSAAAPPGIPMPPPLS